MGQAFDKDGNVLGEATGKSEQEVIEKLRGQFKDAAEIRVREFKAVDFTRATELTEDVQASIVDAFEYHPWTAEQIAHGDVIRKVLVEAVKQIIVHVPPGPDRTVAIRKIREARMDCNSAITHHGRY